MTYEEAIEATVTRAAALDEVKRHGASVDEFYEDLGDHDFYKGADVLGWLGY